MSDKQTTVHVGLLGCGNVGGALAQLLQEQEYEIAQRANMQISIRRIGVRDITKHNGDAFTNDLEKVVDDADVVVELLGGIDPARTLIRRALEQKKPVVTANKALIAQYGGELSALAHTSGVDLLYEAAVGGGIPLVRVLRESLAGEPIRRIVGIINGTTNYILTRMEESGCSYDDALQEAQTLGFAEADPTADVDGIDAAAKASIIASLAFGADIPLHDIHCVGIRNITRDDIRNAKRLGCVIKLLAVIEGEPVAESTRVSARVHPALVPLDHPLASVRHSFNALFVHSAAAGELMFYGRGAGGRPTASAVLGDVIDAAHNVQAGYIGRTPIVSQHDAWPIDEQMWAFCITLDVDDDVGVLARVAKVFGDNVVSITSMEQQPGKGRARLVFMTHRASERNIERMLAELQVMPDVRAIQSVLHVFGVEDDQKETQK